MSRISSDVSYQSKTFCLDLKKNGITIDMPCLDLVLENTFIQIPLNSSYLSSTDRRPVVLLTHFYNEAFLMKQFIRQHAHLFDKAHLIDYHSTDASVKVLTILASILAIY